ncbi:hypothetical protein IT413_01815 [Candidatus Peregrinibacteria bacterium]|nr:hypothetical protein [Candidatus Peregrinibacteria bacterium]
MVNPRIEEDDDGDQEVALSSRSSAPTSQRRAAELAEMGVSVPLPRRSEDAILGGNGRSGKRHSKVKEARQRRRRLS